MARTLSAKRIVSAFFVNAVLVLICLAWLAPSLGLFVSSFRPKNLIAISGWWRALVPPFSFTLDNYGYVLSRGHMGISFVNSLIIAVPSTVMPIIIAAYAAYAFAWMRFPFKEAIFLGIVALLVVPVQMTLIPVLRLFNGAGLHRQLPRHLARAHGLRAALRDLPPAQLHAGPAGIGARVGLPRRGLVARRYSTG